MAEGVPSRQPSDTASRGAQSDAGGLRWESVDPRLVRSLLMAVNHKRDQASLRARLADLDQHPSGSDRRALLADVAAEVLGAGRIKQKLWPQVVPVLVSEWLPRDDASILALVSLSESALRRSLGRNRTREEQLAFLQSARRTREHNFRTILIRRFEYTYRTRRRRPGSRGSREEPITSLRLKGEGPEEGQRNPYQHVLVAQAELDRLAGPHSRAPLRALVHLPTGAGKTDVAVGWILKRMAADRDVRGHLAGSPGRASRPGR